MKPPVIARIAFDCINASALLVAYAYDWLGNLAHEVVGTAIFSSLAIHNVFNRRWYGKLGRTGSPTSTIVSRAVNLSLLLVMLALLVTSIAISRSVFSFLPLPSSFSMTQAHSFAAYVALLLVGLHLGIQWPVVMAAFRNRLGIEWVRRSWKWLSRALATIVVAFGVLGVMRIDIWSKLAMTITINFWDFESEAAAFLFHHAAIIGLTAVASYYTFRAISSWKR